MMSRKHWIVALLILAIGLFSLAFLQQPAQAARFITTITSDWPDPSMVGQRVTIRATVKGEDGSIVPCAQVRVTNGVNSCTLWNMPPPGKVCCFSCYQYCYLTFPKQGKYVITATYFWGGSSDTEPHTVISSKWW